MTDPDRTFHPAPLDPGLLSRLSAQGLEARRIDDDDRAGADAWGDAVARGFLGSERTEAQYQASFDRSAQRRKIGVFDPAAPLPTTPVATFASWGLELTLPGGVASSCAISSVTVSPTHRRRGLLRALMEGELRTARSHGFPLASLTVSESGIYGRFGFAPAAAAVHARIDVRRAGWIGPQAPGRIDFVTREHGRALAPVLHDRVRLVTPGEVGMPDGHWDAFFGTSPDADKPGEHRVVQYRSEHGDVDGLALYRVTENTDDFPASTLHLEMLLAATDEAYAGLWRFLLSMDLIGTIEVSELSTDEPLWWMIANRRAAATTVTDHHYLRVLDLGAALTARRYAVADQVALIVDDPLGIAGGTVVLATDARGEAVADTVDRAPDGVLTVRLGVAELAALLLGSVSARTLARAGRVASEDPARVARLFASTDPARLSFWY